MKKAGLILVVLCLSVCKSALCVNVSNSDNVSFSIISPLDNSLWIATDGRGIVRLGASGRAFVYSSSKGDFPSDSIAALAFDNAGKLWMKDASGRVFDYSSLDGFVLRNEVPEGLFGSKDLSVRESVSGSVAGAAVPQENLSSGGGPGVLGIILVACVLAAVCFVVLYRRRRTAVLPLSDEDDTQKLSSSPAEPGNVTESNVSNPIISSADFLEKVKSLIRENFSDPEFSVEDIAAATGLSRVHVNRKLKASCNTSPSALIKAERMNRASELILEGRLPVTEIASRCGFSSQAYFSSAFKEYFGVTPSAYKENRG